MLLGGLYFILYVFFFPADVRVKILPMSLRGLAKEEGDDDGSSKGEKLATTGVSFTDKDTKKTDSTGDAVSPAMSRFINELVSMM